MHRSLSIGQRALIAVGFLEYERVQAKKRQATSSGGKNPQLKENFPEAVDSSQSRDKAGAQMHVSGRTVDEAARVIAFPAWRGIYFTVLAV